MTDAKKIIEAALFISGRWMTVDDLVRVVGSGSIGAVKEAVKELKAGYDARDGGIRMSAADDDKGGRYRLEISPDARDKVYYLAPEPELSPALIKTLALIAFKQPITQSKVVEVIGNRAYEYIKELRKKEFIIAKKKGRSRLLMTTGHFRKYFGMPEGAQWKPELDAKLLEEAQKKLHEVIDEGPIEDIDDEEGEDIIKKEGFIEKVRKDTLVGDKDTLIEDKDTLVESVIEEPAIEKPAVEKPAKDSPAKKQKKK